MFINKFLVKQDLMLIKELSDISRSSLAKDLGVSLSTVERWESNEVTMSDANKEVLYAYAFKNNIQLNKIKAQLYQEDYAKQQQVLLFHGAKNILDGPIDIQKSGAKNDFGKGFYCGETYEQSSLFVSSFSSACVYIMNFNNANLASLKFQVDQEWMLAIAYFRGKLQDYEESLYIKNIIEKVNMSDFIIAPIADNRMFQIIDSFINGEITDEQCQHCLAATNLGYQYVFRTEKALQNITLLERCYLCTEEKEMYLDSRNKDRKISEDKIKIARIQYRGKGQYIDEILI